MKYYIIAGEASGDLHAGNLIKALKKIDTDAHFRCWGGEHMQSQGVELVKHYKDLAFMGFWEVLMNLSTVLRNLRFCKKDLLSFSPDVLILVDYPGFNMRIAQFAHQKNIKVVYYIAPQVWAWHRSRIKQMKAYIDHLYVILPFEKEFFKQAGIQAYFVGHPLLDAIENHQKQNLSVPQDKEIIALLPGSRRQEIRNILAPMLSITERFPEYHFVIAASPHIPKEFYDMFILEKPVTLVFGQTYDLLAIAKAALVKSGTATLETALFGVPEVVCYKGNSISYRIAKKLVGRHLKYISLVNLIADKAVVKELIQDDLNRDSIEKELLKILKNTTQIKSQLEDFQNIRIQLGEKGASDRLANCIFSKLIR